MFMNNNKKCLACGGKPKQGTSSIIVNGHYLPVKIPLIKHHIRYNPELIGHVHAECHNIIHDENDPRYKHLIQYESGESREYYAKKN